VNNHITEWNYEQSVNKSKKLFISWKNITSEFIEELYNARKTLSSSGQRNDLVPNGTRSWTGYLKDVGIARTTAHRWLERYIPEERKLLTLEEYKEKKEYIQKEKESKEKDQKRKLYFREKYNTLPENWNDDDEKQWVKFQKEEKERDERIRQLKKESIKTQQEKENRQNETSRLFDEVKRGIEYFTNTEMEKQEELKKLRISNQNGHILIVIADYISGLNNDNERIEECQNIIKYCKRKAVDLQKV
jgi:hypothetical protein